MPSVIFWMGFGRNVYIMRFRLFDPAYALLRPFSKIMPNQPTLNLESRQVRNEMQRIATVGHDWALVDHI